MPRPKPKASSKAWFNTPIQLSNEAKEELADYLGLDVEEAEPLLAEIAEVMGDYEHLKRGFDDYPRPAHTKAALSPVNKQANTLHNALHSLDEESRRLLSAHKIDIGQLGKELKHLEQVTFSIHRDIEGDESRGHPTMRAEWLLVESLQAIFDKGNSIEDECTPDTRKQFIQAAFKAAGINPPNLERI